MTEVDAAQRAAERGDSRTWRERALAAEAENEKLGAELADLKHRNELLTLDLKNEYRLRPR